jgi:hypothetical protein
MSLHDEVLRAVIAQASEVGSGKIKGGWEFVWAAYIITWVGVVVYGLSLWLRHKSQKDNP